MSHQAHPFFPFFFFFSQQKQLIVTVPYVTQQCTKTKKPCQTANAYGH